MHEETLNIQLGSAFRRAASWRQDNVYAEQKRLLSGSQRCDVLVSAESLPPVAVECELDRYGSNPVAAAEKRLGAVCRQGVAHCAGEAIGHAVAVLYPLGADQWAEDDIADKLDAVADLKYKLVYRASDGADTMWPSSGWLEGSVSDLCEFISKVSVWEEDIAEVCGAAADMILAAAARLRAKLAGNPGDLARVAMEMGSEDDPETGTDIAPIAVHLTATSLVSMLAGVPYLETNIGMTEIGVFPETAIGSDGKIKKGEPSWVATGSLELINGRDMPLFSTVYSPVTGEKSKNLPLLKAPDNSFDVVLMNPPYSRTRGGQAAFDLSQISDKARPIVQERVRKLAGKTCGNMKAGLGSVFAGIADRKLKDGGRVGSWAILPHSHVWGAAGSEGLVGIVATAAEMIEGRLSVSGEEVCQFPVKPLDEVFDIGPTHHRIGHLAGKEQIGAFELHPLDPENPHRSSHDFALWAANSKTQTTISETPTHYGIEHDKAKTQAIRSTASNLFYQRNIRWTSQKILVAATEVRCLGGRAWAALQGGEEISHFAFAVWANSIFGFVSHWHQTGRQQAGRSLNQIKDTKRIIVPDFANPALQARAKQHLSKRHHLLTIQLARANQANTDPNRQQLNQAAAHILGIPEEHRDFVIADLSDRWTKEPSVAG